MTALWRLGPLMTRIVLRRTLIESHGDSDHLRVTPLKHFTDPKHYMKHFADVLGLAYYSICIYRVIYVRLHDISRGGFYATLHHFPSYSINLTKQRRSQVCLLTA